MVGTARIQAQLTPPRKMPYFTVLDGWRGISILLVLATHMLPIGPSSWNLNEAVGRVGMSIFFTLSGFLITMTLMYRPNIKNFLIRRIFRILPLAWAFLVVALPLISPSLQSALAHIFFYANNHPPYLLENELTTHYWSLCMEIQFYLFIAFLYSIFKDRGLILLVPLCLFFTGCRIFSGEISSMVTPFRVDEIFVGCCLALAIENRLGSWLPSFFSKINPIFPLVLLFLASHSAFQELNYFRAYIAVTVVGSTVYQEKSRLSLWLKSKKLKYIAQISYALYVIHPLTYHGWLGSGDTLVKYAKRPISFALSFGLAHLSTFYYESYWIKLAKRLTSQKPDKIASKPAASQEYRVDIDPIEPLQILPRGSSDSLTRLEPNQQNASFSDYDLTQIKEYCLLLFDNGSTIGEIAETTGLSPAIVQSWIEQTSSKK